MHLQGDQTTWWIMGDAAALSGHVALEDSETLAVTVAESPDSSLDITETNPIPVIAGRAYLLKVPVKPALDMAYGLIWLQWLDAAGTVIDQDAGPYVFMKHDWSEEPLWARAPENAVSARPLVRFETSREGAKGSLRLRAAELVPSLYVEAAPSRVDALYEQGQAAAYHVGVTGYGDDAAPITLKLCVKDYEGTTIHEVERSLVAGAGAAEVDIALPASLDAGYYLVEIEAGADGLASARIERSFGVMGALDFEPQADHPISLDAGMSWPTTREGSRVEESMDQRRLRTKCEACYRMGLRSLRDRLSWGQVNPAPGEFDWGKYAVAADAQSEAGLTVYTVFHDVPEWAAMEACGGKTRGNLPPSDPRDSYAFAKQLAEDLGDRVRFFELWNEPDVQFFGGYVWDYASVIKAAYLGAKAGDPTLGVLWGSRCVRSEFWRKALENGCGPYWDIFNQHSYNAPETQWEFHEQDREMMASVGPLRPIWMTEMGRRCEPSPDGSYKGGEREQVSYLLRAHACGFASGIERFHYFYLQEFLEYGISLWGLMREDLSPRPAFMALGTLIRQLGQARPVGYLPQDQAVCVVFERSEDDYVGLAWALDGSPMTLPTRKGAYLVNPVGARGRDLVAGETRLILSDQPVFVRGIAPERMALRPVPPHPHYEVKDEPVPEAMRLWIRAIARPGVPYPSAKEMLAHKLAARTNEGDVETVEFQVYNWTEQDREVRLDIALPAGWQLAEQSACTLGVLSGESATVRVSAVVGDLLPDEEYALSARLWVAGQPGDAACVYYRKAE